MLTFINVVFSRDIKIYLRHVSKVPPWRMRNTFCKTGIISTIYEHILQTDIALLQKVILFTTFNGHIQKML